MHKVYTMRGFTSPNYFYPLIRYFLTDERRYRTFKQKVQIMGVVEGELFCEICRRGDIYKIKTI